MIGKLLSLRAFVLRTANALAWVPLTVARLALGWVFVQSGWGKLHNLPQVVDYFTSLGIPAPHLQAPFVAGVELVGGPSLLGGLFTRVVSVPLAMTMVVALLTAKRADIAQRRGPLRDGGIPLPPRVRHPRRVRGRAPLPRRDPRPAVRAGPGLPG